MTAPRHPPAGWEYSHAFRLLPRRAKHGWPRHGHSAPLASWNQSGRAPVHGSHKAPTPRPWTPRRRPASAVVDAIVGVSVRPASSPRAFNGDCVSLSGPPFSSYFLTLPLELQSPPTRAAAARVRAFRRALDLTAALRPRGASEVGGGVAVQRASAHARAAGGRSGVGGGVAALWPDLPGAAGAPRGWRAGGGARARAESCRLHFSPPALPLPLSSAGPCNWAKSAT